MNARALREQLDRWSGKGARAAARARGERLFHPRGECFVAEVRPSGDGPLAAVGASTCQVRLSKGLGLGGALPDALGISVRFLGDRPWDLLLISSASPGVLGRMVPAPSTAWTAASFSTVMPYRCEGGDLTWFHARAADDRWISCRRGALTEAVAERPLELMLHGSGRGSGSHGLGSLILTRPVSAEWSFDPVLNTGAGCALAPGWLASVRAGAYRGSRAARGAALREQAGS
ncbi:hypothetical protein HT102_08190 [Hoyosella sp. G463]|uniref:Phosphodiesterase n=1 Tax=Lolliginicoccus lacisalsi TaxID=2742202 RepID=A0A927JCD1_9ACTN|nr:hypothetical protein [Lolliginicoccus lacisalsi]MBD8506461.1 hypothetical protein [Lolliginicoccus lacisalsi]